MQLQLLYLVPTGMIPEVSQVSEVSYLWYAG